MGRQWARGRLIKVLACAVVVAGAAGVLSLALGGRGTDVPTAGTPAENITIEITPDPQTPLSHECVVPSKVTITGRDADLVYGIRGLTGHYESPLGIAGVILRFRVHDGEGAAWIPAVTPPMASYPPAATSFTVPVQDGDMHAQLARDDPRVLFFARMRVGETATVDLQSPLMLSTSNNGKLDKEVFSTFKGVAKRVK